MVWRRQIALKTNIYGTKVVPNYIISLKFKLPQCFLHTYSILLRMPKVASSHLLESQNSWGSGRFPGSNRLKRFQILWSSDYNQLRLVECWYKNAQHVLRAASNARWHGGLLFELNLWREVPRANLWRGIWGTPGVSDSGFSWLSINKDTIYVNRTNHWNWNQIMREDTYQLPSWSLIFSINSWQKISCASWDKPETPLSMELQLHSGAGC